MTGLPYCRSRLAALWGLAFAAALGGCAVPPRQDAPAARPDAVPARSGEALPPASDAERDGAPLHPPADLARTPDAVPAVEPIRAGGPNKPYAVRGQRYVPITRDEAYTERGLASWYGRKFQGRRTASGEVYNMYAMTAAHPTLPIPSYVRVRNPANGREVVVRVNDRGPFHSSRVIDLSYTAALKLDLLRGVAPVEIERLTSDVIRSGAWRRGGDEAGDAVEVASTTAGTSTSTSATAPRGASPDAAHSDDASLANGAPRAAPAESTVSA